MDWIKSNKALSAILILCLVTRLAFFFAVRPWEESSVEKIFETDGVQYHQIAINLLHYHQFSLEKDGPPNSYRTPIYPMYLALFALIFGDTPWVVLVSQIVISTLSCFLLYLMFNRVFNKKIALYASLFFCLDPFLILHCTKILSDTLIVFILILGTYTTSFLFVNNHKNNKVKIVLLTGFLFGLATLTKPITTFIPLLIILLMFYEFRKKISIAITYAIVLIIIFTLTISPWLIRNYLAFNSISLSSIGSLSLLYMYIPPMEMQRRGQSYEEVRISLLSEADSLIVKDGLKPETMNDFQKSKYWRAVALKYVIKYPLPFTKFYALGLFHYFSNLGTTAFSEMLDLNTERKEFDIKAYPNILLGIQKWFQQKSFNEIIVGFIVLIFLLITYVSTAIGLVVSWKRYSKAFLIFCTLMVIYFAVLTGPYSLVRYKLPSIPYYLAFAGIGFDYIINKRKRETNSTSKVFHNVLSV